MNTEIETHYSDHRCGEYAEIMFSDLMEASSSAEEYIRDFWSENCSGWTWDERCCLVYTAEWLAINQAEQAAMSLTADQSDERLVDYAERAIDLSSELDRANTLLVLGRQGRQVSPALIHAKHDQVLQ